MRGFMILAVLTSVAITMTERVRFRSRAAAEQRVRDFHELDSSGGNAATPLHSN
jgi:hypothetical protein